MVDTHKLESLSLSRVDEALRFGTSQDVASLLADMEPGDVAHLINASPPETRDIIWPLLETEQEADVLNELPDDLRNQFLSDLQPEAVASIVRQLDDDDVADILHELPATVTDDVLEALTDSDRTRLTATLDFPDDVAGGLMSTDVLTIRADLTLDVVAALPAAPY